jgi:hypothetical protein
MARAAEALATLPSRTAARAELACICHDLSLPEAAGVFARDHERFAQQLEQLERDTLPSPGPRPSTAGVAAGPDLPRELVQAQLNPDIDGGERPVGALGARLRGRPSRTPR